MSEAKTLVHATAVAIDGLGILIMGRSGSGKSDMALRLIDRRAVLISDDAVVIKVADNHPLLVAAANIEGRLEVRGVGICTVPAVTSAPLRLIVNLDDQAERLPRDHVTRAFCGFDVPLFNIAPFETSAAIKVEYALRSVVDAGRWPVAIGTTASAESTDA